MDTTDHASDPSVWKSRTVALMATFGVLCLTAARLPSPWWSGPLLDVQVSWPASLTWAGLGQAMTSSDAAPPAPLVELVHEAELPALPAPPDAEAALAQQAHEALTLARVAALAAARGPGAGQTPDAQTQQLLQRLSASLDKLPAPTVRLERPCLTRDATGRCTLRALDTFFETLRQTALRKRDEPTRLSQFGDSLISGDGLTGELRRLLQDTFGDGGHGFVPLQAPSRFMGFEGLKVSSNEAWRLDTIAQGGKQAHERALGVGGVAFELKGSPTLKILARDKGRTFNALGIMAAPKQGPIEIKLKTDQAQQTLALTPSALRDRVHWVALSPQSAQIELSGFRGEATYYGVLVERHGGGVVVDNFGMLSTQASSLTRMDSAHWKGQLKSRGVHLASFSFGTNSAGPGKPSQPWLDNYKKVYAHVLKAARALEDDRDCMVLGLLTRGAKTEAGITQLPSVEPLVQAQRETARSAGCAFWDMNAVMGGSGGVLRWYQASPRLLGSDLAHPTKSGYRHLAQHLYAALMVEFKLYLEGGPGAGQDPTATP